MNMNGVLIGSEDPQSLAAYYTKIFGKADFESDGFRGWQLGSGWVTVGLHDEVKGKNVHPGRMIWIIETSDVQGEFDRMRDAGALVVREPYNPGDASDMWIATLSDPDGNYFQLLSPM